jgi:UDP-glucose 6-dehydrogenase
MKIAVAGIGYVGLSNAVLLAQKNDVVAVDISEARVAQLNAKRAPTTIRSSTISTPPASKARSDK